MAVSEATRVVRFGLFELDTKSRQLTRSGVRIRLSQQPIQVLGVLLERPGTVVTREELQKLLWPADVFVDFDHGLNKSIQKLREALGDSPESPRYVETVPRIGYRFIAPVITASAAGEVLPQATRSPSAALPLPDDHPQGKRSVGSYLAIGIALALLLGVVTFRMVRRPQFPGARPIQSLAVLPLENLSGNSSQDYFADGMTDELITMLAKESSLRIVSRTSVMQYRGARRPLPEIARALHADAILEGSVSRSADHVHMNLQLIRADTDSHLWAESYERDANDVALPDEAAKAIANQLQRAVPAVKANRSVSPAAHDAYLHGNYLWFGNDMGKSGAWFRKAIDLQPDYALAWAGLADYYGEGIVTSVLDPRTSIVPEEQAAERALALDPDLSQAHQAMSAMFLIDRWDWADADREILRAISLDPQNGELYYLRASVLQAVNRNAEAIELGKKAMELDPFSRPYALAGLYAGARQFDAALEEIRLRLEANPNNLDLLGLEADTLRRMGRYKEAVDVWARWQILIGDPQSAVTLRRAWDRGGAHGFVRWQLDQRLLQSKSGYVSPVELASYYAQLGDKERTIALLEEGYRQHALDILWIQGDPAYDFLHSDRRFRSIVQRTGVVAAF
jgi:TolB-like protein/DNA-binding winged helix-turn-helix (wHTH) protein/Tfp pilus assembly protein PilF